jgi:hypothetical protein
VLAAKKKSKSAAPPVAKPVIAKAQTKAENQTAATSRAALKAKHMADFQNAAKELATVFDKENAKY